MTKHLADASGASMSQHILVGIVLDHPKTGIFVNIFFFGGGGLFNILLIDTFKKWYIGNPQVNIDTLNISFYL